MVREGGIGGGREGGREGEREGEREKEREREHSLPLVTHDRESSEPSWRLTISLVRRRSQRVPSQRKTEKQLKVNSEGQPH